MWFWESGLVMPLAIKKHLASYVPLSSASICLTLLHEALIRIWILVSYSEISQPGESRTKINLFFSSSFWYFVISIEKKRLRKPPKLSFRNPLVEQMALQGKATNVTMTQEKKLKTVTRRQSFDPL